jgi:hypothetical protein
MADNSQTMFKFFAAVLLVTSLTLPAAAQPDPAQQYLKLSAMARRNLADASLLNFCGVRSKHWFETLRLSMWVALNQARAELQSKARDPAAFDRTLAGTDLPNHQRLASYENCQRAIAEDLPRLDHAYDLVRYR